MWKNVPKWGKMYQNGEKCTKMSIKIPNVHKISMIAMCKICKIPNYIA
jgi:hypothetical protein